MMSVDPRIHGYTAERTAQFLTDLRQRVAGLPGVISAACTDSVPLSGGNRSDAFHAEGRTSTGPDPIVELYMATSGYFETMGIPRRQGMLLVLIAMALGLAAALAAAKLFAAFLYGVRPYDLVTFTAVPLFLATVALLACWIPARRAARVDPLTALRYE